MSGLGPVALDGAGDVRTPGAELIDYFRVLRRRKGTVLLVVVAFGLLGIGSVLPQAPVYRTSAQIEVQGFNEEFGYSKDVNVGTTGSGAFPDVDLATQVKVLGTRRLLDRAIDKLDADLALQIVPPADRLASWRVALHLPAQPVPGRREALERVAGSLNVKPVRNSRVIELQCDSEDPHLAAIFANTLAREFIDMTVETRWQSAKHTGEWLTRQLDEIKRNLEKSEDQLQSYATQVNLVFAGDKDRANVSQERLSQLQTELSAAQADRVAKQSRYEMAMTGSSESLGQVVDDQTLRIYL